MYTAKRHEWSLLVWMNLPPQVKVIASGRDKSCTIRESRNKALLWAAKRYTMCTITHARTHTHTHIYIQAQQTCIQDSGLLFQIGEMRGSIGSFNLERCHLTLGVQLRLFPL